MVAHLSDATVTNATIATSRRRESSPARIAVLTAPLGVLLCFSAAMLDSQLGESTWRWWWAVGAVVGLTGTAAALASQRGSVDAITPKRQALLEELIQLTTEGVVTVDDQGTIQFANAGAHHTLGSPAGGLVGTRFEIPESGAPHVVVHLESEHSSQNRVVEIHPVDIDVAGVPTRAALLRDVTPLVESGQRAKSVVRGHERFLRGVSREIRDPLTAIVGFSAILANSVELVTAHEAAEISATIAQEAAAISALVDNLLVTAVADPMALAVDRQPVDLEAVLTTIDGAIPITTHSRHHMIVWGDRRRIEQIVRNLTSNARRHGGTRVWIELSQAGGRVRLAVCDDGPGIADDSTHAAFEPYGGDLYAGERETVGIGLHVAKLLAHRLGGALQYRREGTITRFELMLTSTAHVEDSLPHRQT